MNYCGISDKKSLGNWPQLPISISQQERLDVLMSERYLSCDLSMNMAKSLLRVNKTFPGTYSSTFPLFPHKEVELIYNNNGKKRLLNITNLCLKVYSQLVDKGFFLSFGRHKVKAFKEFLKNGYLTIKGRKIHVCSNFALKLFQRAWFKVVPQVAIILDFKIIEEQSIFNLAIGALVIACSVGYTANKLIILMDKYDKFSEQMKVAKDMLNKLNNTVNDGKAAVDVMSSMIQRLKDNLKMLPDYITHGISQLGDIIFRNETMFVVGILSLICAFYNLGDQLTGCFAGFYGLVEEQGLSSSIGGGIVAWAVTVLGAPRSATLVYRIVKDALGDFESMLSIDIFKEVVNAISSHVLGSPIFANQNAEIYELIGVVDRWESDAGFFSDIIHDDTKAKEVINHHLEMSRHYRRVIASRDSLMKGKYLSAMTTLDSHIKTIQELSTLFTKSTKPVNIALVGKPGQGKNVLRTIITQCLWEFELAQGLFTGPLRKFAYTGKAATSDYYDDYDNQPCVYFDEFLQMQTEEMNAPTALLYVLLANGYPVPLDCAKIENKGKKFMKPNYTIIDSNHFAINANDNTGYSKSGADPVAIERRNNILVVVERRVTEDMVPIKFDLKTKDICKEFQRCYKLVVPTGRTGAAWAAHGKKPGSELRIEEIIRLAIQIRVKPLDQDFDDYISTVDLSSLGLDYLLPKQTMAGEMAKYSKSYPMWLSNRKLEDSADNKAKYLRTIGHIAKVEEQMKMLEDSDSEEESSVIEPPTIMPEEPSYFRRFTSYVSSFTKQEDTPIMVSNDLESQPKQEEFNYYELTIRKELKTPFACYTTRAGFTSASASSEHYKFFYYYGLKADLIDFKSLVFVPRQIDPSYIPEGEMYAVVFKDTGKTFWKHNLEYTKVPTGRCYMTACNPVFDVCKKRTCLELCACICTTCTRCGKQNDTGLICPCFTILRDFDSLYAFIIPDYAHFKKEVVSMRGGDIDSYLSDNFHCARMGNKYLPTTFRDLGGGIHTVDTFSSGVVGNFGVGNYVILYYDAATQQFQHITVDYATLIQYRAENTLERMDSGSFFSQTPPTQNIVTFVNRFWFHIKVAAVSVGYFSVIVGLFYLVSKLVKAKLRAKFPRKMKAKAKTQSMYDHVERCEREVESTIMFKDDGNASLKPVKKPDEILEVVESKPRKVEEKSRKMGKADDQGILQLINATAFASAQSNYKMLKRLRNQTIPFATYKGTSVIYHGFIFMATGRRGFIPKHFLSTEYEGIIIGDAFSPMVQIQKEFIKTFYYEENEACLIQLIGRSNVVQGIKNTKLKNLKDIDQVLNARRVGWKQSERHRHGYMSESFMLAAPNVVEYTTTGLEHRVRSHTLVCTSNTGSVAGDCGLPVINGDCRNGNGVIGIHFAGSANATFVTAIFQEFLEMPGPIDMDSCSSEPFGMAKIERIDEQCQANLLIVPGTNCTGKTKRYHSSGTPNKIVPSCINFDMIDEKPLPDLKVHLLPCEPYIEGDKKIEPSYGYNRFDDNINIKPNFSVLSDVYDRLPFFMNGFLAKPKGKFQMLDLDLKRALILAVFGDANKGIKPLDHHTTVGPVLKAEGFSGRSTGNKPCWNVDTKELSPAFFNIFKKYWNYQLENPNSPGIVITRIKNELRPEEKTKNRLYYSGCLLDLCFSKVVLGNYVSYSVKNRNIGASAVGMNPYSNDWRLIVIRIKMRKLVRDGDYSGLDRSIIGFFGECFTKYILSLYDLESHPQLEVLVRAACAKVYNPYVLWGSYIRQVPRGFNPSGSYFTTHYNNFVVYLSNAVTSFYYHQRHLSDLGRFDMSKFGLIVFGDDHIHTYDYSIDLNKYAEYMRILFGLVLTPAEKGGSFHEIETSSLEKSDLSFLKRKFRCIRERGVDHHYGVIERNSLFKAIMYRQKSKSMDEAEVSAMDSILLEMPGQGKDFYHEFLSIVKPRIPGTPLEFYDFPSYEALCDRMSRSKFPDAVFPFVDTFYRLDIV